MKSSTTLPQASHVNSGTAIPREDLPWPGTRRPVMRLGKTHVEIDERSTVTAYGGLDLLVPLLRRLKAASVIDEHLDVLKLHLPYHESDHVLAQASSLYCGGTCLEDLANLQGSEAIRRILGASRIPDPTTAGDFLRRFDEGANPGSFRDLRQSGDEIQERAWRLIRRRRSKAYRAIADGWTAVDIDGHIEATSGSQREGADFSHSKKWSYQPLVVSLAGTNEVLALRLRPGNQTTAGAQEVLRSVLPRVKAQFGRTLLRGDSQFERQTVWGPCEEAGNHFALVAKAHANRLALAEQIPEKAWTPFVPRAERAEKERRQAAGHRQRRRKPNRRRARARERGYKELALTDQWLAEVPLQPHGAERPFRLIIRKQRIENRKGELFLFEQFRYRFVLTNLPRSWSAQDVIDTTYQRCDQENIVEQLGSGVAAWRMPVAEFAGNAAWLEIARLAWNLGKWIAQLALPPETVRWEWKRFRHAFVIVPAQVVKKGRQTWVRFAGSHRFARQLATAHRRLE